MLDFLRISKEEIKKKDKTIIKIFPKFKINLRTEDLMIKGGDFYAIWDEEKGLWSTSEQSVIDQVDKEIDNYIKKHGFDRAREDVVIMPCYMEDSDSGSIDKWHKYCKLQMRDRFVMLDEKIIFSNTPVGKSDYASKRLDYPLEEGPIDAYLELFGTLYEQEELDKLEWAIGAIISGDSKHIQKFEVLYGDKGTGKGTFLDLVEKLFKGYTSVFNAKDLGSANNAFALESFKDNPLVSIQTDGNLSRIEDNTKLNSIVSHETMEVNAKYTKLYTSRFVTFLFMGTNSPVKITEAKSGLLRRLIDVRPSGNKVPYKRYHQLKNQLSFELGAIAYHCLKKYQEMGEEYYENYIPIEMMAMTNDFYDFVDHNYDDFVEKDMVTLAEAWHLYKEYCEFAAAKQLPLRIVRTELANYFREFKERAVIDGKQVRNLYSGFKYEKFEFTDPSIKVKNEEKVDDWLTFKEQKSIFDEVFAEEKAQGSKEDGSPLKSWDNVTTKLSDIDTKTLHWVLGPSNLVFIDFDKRNEKGEKDLKLNIEAAKNFKKTYAEVSKSGGGLHLVYFYDGDLSEVSNLYDDNIEIKPCGGKRAIRRLLTKCNSEKIATLSRGSLPLRKEKKVINFEGLKDDKHLHAVIRKYLSKKIVGDTTSSVDLIKKTLDEAYESGIEYDVTDLAKEILDFARKSTNQAEKCVNTVGQMKLASKSIHISEVREDENGRLVFIDIEVYKNLFVVVWKYEWSDTCVHMINPKPWEVEELFKLKLVGFNCRNYDNHILYAASRGYTTQKLYELSQNIINNKGNGKIGAAYDISYTDVYDFCTEKKSLKKWEIEYGIHHQEMPIPWDQEVPEDRIMEVVGYCENDVRATEYVFHKRAEDFMARKIQVDLVRAMHGDDIYVTVNDTTNTLSKRFIFGGNTSPQDQFNYRDLSKPVGSDQYERYLEKFGPNYKFRVFNDAGLPVYRDYIPGEVLPKGYSILPFWPEYKFGYSSNSKYYNKEITDEVGFHKSVYLGYLIGEGGRVYSRRGLWRFVWDGDISSMHPHSIIAEMLFGPKYTLVFAELVEARVAIKHKDYDRASKLLGGVLKPYLTDEYAKGLAQALKIVINAIYGLTTASFKNEFKDDNNEDNIVAKRGALFMTTLMREVERIKYKVCHIKTDSIKIPNADELIKQFVVSFGREYGYEFETEDEFVKFCLLNDAAYIGKTKNGKYVTKAAQFNEKTSPYVYKTLFSHEEIEFKDMCETKSVNKGALYLDMNEDLGEPIDDQVDKGLKKLFKLMKKYYPIAENDGPKDISEIEKDHPDLANQMKLVDSLLEEQPKHHNLVFIGRIGSFCPVKKGAGGGVLYRVDGGKMYAAPGSSGYRWLESEHIKKYGLQDKIDKDYFRAKVDEAIKDINDVCLESGEGYDFGWFMSDEGEIWPPGPMNVPEGADEEVERPPWE